MLITTICLDPREAAALGHTGAANRTAMARRPDAIFPVRIFANK